MQVGTQNFSSGANSQYVPAGAVAKMTLQTASGVVGGHFFITNSSGGISPVFTRVDATTVSFSPLTQWLLWSRQYQIFCWVFFPLYSVLAVQSHVSSQTAHADSHLTAGLMSKSRPGVRSMCLLCGYSSYCRYPIGVAFWGQSESQFTQIMNWSSRIMSSLRLFAGPGAWTCRWKCDCQWPDSKHKRQWWLWIDPQCTAPGTSWSALPLSVLQIQSHKWIG